MRVACLRLPRFTIHVHWRAAPPTLDLDGPTLPLPRADAAAEWDTRPVAVRVGPHLRVVSAAAGRRGVRDGMTVTVARARCAELVVLPWDELAVRAEVARASAAFVAASPQVTPVRGAPGTWWVGASGFDGLGGERALAAHLLAIARAWHVEARVAIADSCVAARAGTWDARVPVGPHGMRSPVLVPGGHDAEYLAEVPLALLPMPAPLRASLGALGFATGGAFAALDPADVEQRWGPEGLAAWRLARGDDPRRPFLPRHDAPRTVHTELGGPAETTEPLLFLVRAALERLVAQGAADGRAVAAVTLTLTLDDARGATPDRGGHARTVTREARPAEPIARVGPLFEQCRALLAAWPLPAPVTAMTVAISATAPLAGRQGDLLDASWRDLAAVEAALARLPEPRPRPGAVPDTVELRRARLHRLLENALTTPLPLSRIEDAAAPLQLCTLPPSRRRVEMEFHLPAQSLTPEALNAFLDRYGYASPTLGFATLRGFLKGFIDLVFEHQGRYWVLDWKSNWLGTHPSLYGPQAV